MSDGRLAQKAVPIYVSRPHCSVALRGMPARANDYDPIAALYNEAYGDEFCEEVTRHILQLIERHDLRVNRVLDMACGAGALLGTLGRHFGCECFGVDISRLQLAAARQRLRKKGVRASLSVGNAAHAELPRACDLVTMTFDAINHLRSIREVQRAMSKAYAALRPGGLFIFDAVRPERLRIDFEHPELLIREGISCLQCGIRISVRGAVTRRTLYVEVHPKGVPHRPDGAVLIEHIAVTPAVMRAMLRDVGFHPIRRMPFCRGGTNRPFLDHRDLFVAVRPR